MDGVTLIFGKSWTGKTVRMVHELQSESRVILVDPKCAQLAKLRGWAHLWPEFDSKLKLFRDCTVSDGLRRVRHGDFKVIIHLRHSHREALESLALMALAVKRCVFAVDELGLFVPGAGGGLPPHITSLVVSGTHDGIRFMGTAQRPSLVHPTIRANAARMLFYRMTEAADADMCDGYLGAEFNVRMLPPQVCFDWRDGRDTFMDSSHAGQLSGVLPGSR